MNLRELVGKKVIRTAPFMDKNIITERGILVGNNERVVELPDYSFCDCYDTVITVLEVVQDTPIVEIKTKESSYIRPISGEYDDDNWKDVTEVINRVCEINRERRSGNLSELLSKLSDGYGLINPELHGIKSGKGVSHLMMGLAVHNILEKALSNDEKNTNANNTASESVKECDTKEKVEE